MPHGAAPFFYLINVDCFVFANMVCALQKQGFCSILNFINQASSRGGVIPTHCWIDPTSEIASTISCLTGAYTGDLYSNQWGLGFARVYQIMPPGPQRSKTEETMKRATFALAALLALPLAAGCSDLIDDSASSSDNFALGDAIPGTNADQLRRGEGELRPDRDAAGRPRADLQRTQLLRLPLQRRDRRRRPADRAALRHAHERRVQRPRQHGRLAAPAVRHRRLQPEPGRQLPVGHGRQPGAGRDDLRGPRDDADLRPRPGRADPRRHASRGSRRLSRRRSAASRSTTPSSSRAGPSRAGRHHVARFGWKAVHASLADFAADAYLNEMGITTTSCAGGTVVNDFATENRANRAPTNAVINGCPDDLVPGTDDNFAAEEQQLRGRPHRGPGRRGELRVLHAQPGPRRRAASTTATAAA